MTAKFPGGEIFQESEEILYHLPKLFGNLFFHRIYSYIQTLRNLSCFWIVCSTDFIMERLVKADCTVQYLRRGLDLHGKLSL
jgi:hypothetical protein